MSRSRGGAPLLVIAMLLGVSGLVLAAIVALPAAALAQGPSEADLAKQSQNPVADLISLPFQNNTFFGVGPDDDTANVLNIQPVIPISIGPVNLINRTMVPLIYLPDVTAGLAELPEGISGGSTVGLGDINYTGWLYSNTAPENKGNHFQSGRLQFTLGTSNVILGWHQGIPGMQVGGLRRLVIPPELAYGSSTPDPSTIPPNATLLFEVELVSIP